MFWFRESTIADSIAKQIRELVNEMLGDLKDKLSGIRSIAQLEGERVKLKEQIETLKIEKARKDEEFERKEREIEHKVGLERKRQEFELESAKRDATLTVREENLKADRSRFEEQMAFQNKRFTDEVGYLKDMIGQLAERLPSMAITADVSAGGKRGRAR